ncbi:phospholipase A [Alteromonas halophila]|uniref:Phospholipase A1 n=1 Tax=Alteromonas halophila TaxID=516698 RepID=A0A918MYT2_9ALTE|nr:phospholipase A [Alteromonas halophila]GGW86371.1 phospholipase [Alteromonas halophila]
MPFLRCLLVVLLSVAVSQNALAGQQTEKKEVEGKEEEREGIIDYRLRSDRDAIKNPFAITQHHQNYLLPVTYVTNPNSLGNENLTPDNVDNTEAKFQISVKTPLYLNDQKAGGLYFGFTLTSFWQLYNDEVSKPFRETNYEPELFWQQNTELNVLGYTFNTIQAGFNHMSNGQSGLRSRSWNRLFASLLFSSKENLYYVKAWYRIPEDKKTSPMDATGDDNPNITDYYGRMEFGYGTRFGDVKLLMLIRNNLNFGNNRGSIQLNLNYPLSDRYDLMLQYFNGYGDSLIDYDRSQERIGIGFSLKFL